MPELTVRAATSADADLIANIPGWWDSEGPRPEFAPDLAGWMDAHPSHTCVLAFLDGRVAGMAWMAVIDRVPRPGMLERRSGAIQSVFVVPDARRQGVATALLGALDAIAAQLGLLHLSVHSSTAGIPVYESVGFAATPRLLRKMGPPLR